MLKYHKVFEIPLKELQWDEGLLYLLIACFPLIWSVKALPDGWSMLPVVISWFVLYQVSKFLGRQTSIEIDTVEQQVTIRNEVPFNFFGFLLGKFANTLSGNEGPSDDGEETQIKKIPFEKIEKVNILKVTRNERTESVTDIWISGGYRHWFRVSLSLKGGDEEILKESLHEEESRILAENLSKMVDIQLFDFSENPEAIYDSNELMRVQNTRITVDNRDRDEMIINNHSGSPTLHFKPKSIYLVQRDHFHLICRWNNRSTITLVLLVLLVFPLLVYSLQTIFELLHFKFLTPTAFLERGILNIWEKLEVVGLCPLFLGIFFLAIKFLRDSLGSAMLSVDPNRMHVITAPIYVKRHHLVKLDEVASIRMFFGLAPHIVFLTDREQFSVFGSTRELTYVFWEMTTYFQGRLHRKLDEN